MKEIRARDHILWDNLKNATVQNDPYQYIEVDLVTPEFCALVYEELRQHFWDEYDKDSDVNNSAFAVIPKHDMNNSYAGDLQDALNTWDGWNEWYIEKFDADLGLSHETFPRFGYQGANPEFSFTPHTDEISDTGVHSKGLIYIHDSVGTKMFNHKLVTHHEFVDQHGDTVRNLLPEPYTEATNEVKEVAGVGKLFMFKCTTESYHGTDFSSLNHESKRIILAGTFK